MLAPLFSLFVLSGFPFLIPVSTDTSPRTTNKLGDVPFEYFIYFLVPVLHNWRRRLHQGGWGRETRFFGCTCKEAGQESDDRQLLEGTSVSTLGVD